MKRRRFIGAALATATTPLVAGCGSGGGDGGGGTTQANGKQTETTAAGPGNLVKAAGSTFNPIRLSVETGTKVTWRNNDSYTHTVESAAFHDKAADWTMDARMTSNGGQATHTFEEPGVYEYYCSIHGKSKMCGVILVGDVSLDKSLPCES